MLTLIRWGTATVNLLSGSKKQTVPYLNGNVTLSRCGSFGNFIILRPDLAAHTSGQLPASHCYRFEDFCMSIRATIKSFLPLVGSFVRLSAAESKKVEQGSNDAYLEREKIIKDIFQPTQLASCMFSTLFTFL